MNTVGMSGIVIWLIVLWVLLWESLSVANVIGGLLAAIGVLTVARLPRVRRVPKDERTGFRPFALLWFGVFVLYKLVEANLFLAWEIITPGTRINTGVVAVPLRTESEAAMMVVANVITLTPGTVTIEAIGSPPVLYVHVLHLHDLDQVRADLLRIEELSVRAFGSRSARRHFEEQLS